MSSYRARGLTCVAQSYTFRLHDMNEYDVNDEVNDASGVGDGERGESECGILCVCRVHTVHKWCLNLVAMSSPGENATTRKSWPLWFSMVCHEC